jgi:selenocysteine lyase/cysteine desulfurase
MLTSRRQFLATATAVAAFRDDTAARLAQVDFTQALPQDDGFWTGLRAQFDIDPDYTSFNHAGLAPSPRSVREAMAAQVRRANTDPSHVVWQQQEKELDGVRGRLARLLGCDSAELALTPNATFGLHTVILGLPLHKGEQILTTTHDFSRALYAMRQRERRDGTVTVEVPIATPPAPAAEVAQSILGHINERTRLIVLSQMTYLTGQLLPVRAIADAAAHRGIPLLVDGAHGIGLLPATVADLGCAFYTSCLHKWLMGPVGTGVLFVRSDWIDRVWALHPGDDTLDQRILKFEQGGTRSLAPLLAIGEALDFHERLGRERKAARLEALRTRLAAPLLATPGVQHCGSLDPDRCRALLTVSLDKVPARALADWLWHEHHMHVKPVDRGGLQAIRISPNVFTTHAEVDQLASVLVTAARNGI